MARYQVLLVDDNTVVRRIVRQVLEKESQLRICGEADDGKEALDKAKLLQPDIVILDLSMPRMGGLEAAPQIRNLLPDACLILFTLYGNEEIERVARQVGIDAVVSKADRGDKLVEVARAFFD
jgi:DNA-binding NarL/FixJ family response regulator